MCVYLLSVLPLTPLVFLNLVEDKIDVIISTFNEIIFNIQNKYL